MPESRALTRRSQPPKMGQGGRGMWYLFACVATPVSVSCITPVEVASEVQCQEMASRWRGTAQTTHDKANVRTQCVRIDGGAAGATTPAPKTPDIDIEVPNLGRK